MKRIAILGTILVVVMVLSTLAVAVPTSADPDVVYETVLVPNLENVLNVGTYSTVTLEESEVKVYADGGWKVEIEGLRVDGELFTENLDVLFWPGQSGGPVTAEDALPVEDREGTLTVGAEDTNSIPEGEHPGVRVWVTHGGVAWLLQSGVIIE